ncbi:MAG: twin-arginine translocation pathway signal protein [Rhizobacter sp.]
MGTPEEHIHAIQRRRFLRYTGAALGGAAVGLPAINAAAAECRLTEQEILGPMYNYGAPMFQLKLVADNEPGQKLMLRGSVLSADCKTPLAHTLIEIWQADDKGVYDKQQPGNFLETVKPHLRGMILTDAKGRYEIETIVPGAYPIPPGVPGLEKYGNLTRARHIHIKVEPFLHTALTTQLYFKGDEHLAGDPWGGHKPELALAMKQDGRYMKADFDFVLGTGLKGS